VAQGRTVTGILCSGSIVYDTLVRPVDDPRWGTTTFVETIEYHSGGNGANTALALARLGTPVRLVGAVGLDERGRFLLESLRKGGVDTTGVATVDAPTAATVVMVNHAGDRKFLHLAGAGALAFSEPLQFAPNIIDVAQHYHLASFFILPNFRAHAPRTLRDARAAGLTTSFDTNWDPQGRWMTDLAACLPYLDLMFINEDEARMITGSSDPREAAHQLLQRGVRTAVMKLGSRGCAIFTSDQQHYCPAFDVEVRDTTGAGDCFVAGFLSARARGESLSEAGRFANAVAAWTVQTIGGAAGVRSSKEIELWMTGAPTRIG
jgi:sugar/nucleoside kinase (ribokinase family)